MYQYYENEHLEKLKTDTKKYIKLIDQWFAQHQTTDHNTAFYKALAPRSALPHAIPLTECSDLLIVAMGGASVVSQLICSLAPSTINVHFINSTDPKYFAKICSQIEFNRTNTVIISNSGSTVETIALSKALIQQCQAQNISIYNKILCVTAPNSPLAKLAQQYDITIAAHESQINGRFSLFTNIATILGAILHIDTKEFIMGSNEILYDFWQQQSKNKAVISALALISIQQHICIKCTYSRQLLPLVDWNTQIINESLAKFGQPWCAYSSTCPQDQHGVFQPYLAGCNDKVFTFFIDETPHYSSPLYHTHHVAQDCTIKALEQAKRPMRYFTLRNMTPRIIGMITTHLMIETIMVGEILGLNPFIQPEIEKLKWGIRRMAIDTT